MVLSWRGIIPINFNIFVKTSVSSNVLETAVSSSKNGVYEKMIFVAKGAVFCYNNLEVNYMSNLPEDVLKKIELLSKPEVKELVKKLVNTLDGTDIQELMAEIHDELEAMGILKIVEENFDDWDNEEDSYYDTL